ncbi:MAG TPA: alpha/beta hydrolase [Actinomycetota bacterium]|nr:alpha/beta hydrolase [Actinomycetota bacterium]
MSRVASKDGTSIAYERRGKGPAVILVGGAIDDGSENAPLVPELATTFMVYNYARRGRGESGDTPPYAVDREVEDLEALIAEAGGSAHVFGASSGGGLALEAAAAGLSIDRLAVYEVPYNMDDDGPHWNRGDVPEVEGLLAEGRRGDVVELFMRTVGSSEEDIEGARGSPFWPALEALAHTLAYDAACMGDGPPPTARLAKIIQPTLVATGGGHPDSHAGGLPSGFMDRAADAIAASIPRAERQIIEGGGHMVDAKLVAPVLERFFRG